MRHKRKEKKLSRTRDQRRALLSGQVKNLITHGEIVTTESKAKETARLAERMISLAKKDSVHHRRIAFKVIKDRETVNRLFSVVASRYGNKNGGYTRITRLGYRRGDNALMCKVRFV